MNARQASEWLDKVKAIRENRVATWERNARIAEGKHKANQLLYNCERSLCKLCDTWQYKACHWWV